MNKGEFVSFISEKNGCSKADAEKTVDMFTSAVTAALGKGDSVALVGFGSFNVADVAARTGRNPQTGAPLKIAAYKQPKFKAGQKLKDACN